MSYFLFPCWIEPISRNPSIAAISYRIAQLRGPNNDYETNAILQQEAIILLTQLWLNCAGIYTNQNQDEDAIMCLNEALSFQSLSSEVYCGYGKYYWRHKEYKRAISNFERALILNSEHVKSLIYLSLIYIELDTQDSNETERQYRLDMAEHYLETAVALDPHDFEGWYGLGLAMVHTGRKEHANDYFLRSAYLESTYPIREFDCAGHIYGT